MEHPTYYTPKPPDLNGISLPDILSSLTEDIAENLHDVWARSRLDEGWIWGYKRDDTLRTTPCRVPYADLPENEKTYDRQMVIATLKILACKRIQNRKVIESF